ncbi:MAG: hypothetical protein ACI88A_001593 [Paraglaciecola sp.]|jgi:hypothetical protein
MSISDLGNIANMIASIGVLFTLIFLVFELRRNTKLTIRANSRETYVHNGQTLHALMDKEISELFLRGNTKGLSSLTPEERYRFDLAYTYWLQSCEQAFSDHRTGLFPSDQIQAIENGVVGWLTSPGGIEWWAEREVWFGRLFRNEVNTLLQIHSDEGLKAGQLLGNRRIITDFNSLKDLNMVNMLNMRQSLSSFS